MQERVMLEWRKLSSSLERGGEEEEEEDEEGLIEPDLAVTNE